MEPRETVELHEASVESQAPIEVELRGLLTPTQYHALQQRLLDEGVPCQADDKESYFFNFPRGVLKVCDEISQDRGKISLKLGKEAEGALEEHEIFISRDQVNAAITLLVACGYGEPHQVTQDRMNYALPTATLSLKFTEDFRHHFELEGEPVYDPSFVEEEKRRLRSICLEYGLVPLEPEEIEERVNSIKRRIGFDAME